MNGAFANVTLRKSYDREMCEPGSTRLGRRTLATVSGANKQARRARVMEQAAKTLNGNGISQSSLGEIADALGLTRPALYYYFKDQEDLVFQSYRRSCEILSRRLGEARRKEADPLAVVDSLLQGMLNETETASLDDIAYLQPDKAKIIATLYQAIVEDLSDVLDQGIQAGKIRPCATFVVAHVIIGMISAAAVGKRKWHNPRVAHADLVEAIRAIVRRGVTKRRREPVLYQPIELGAHGAAGANLFDSNALAAAKQDAMLASASWLFNLKGIGATTLDDIAARLGVTKKAIYRNVGDKETLIVACFKRSIAFYDDLAVRASTYRGSKLEALYASWHASGEASLREDIAPIPLAMGFEPLPENITGWVRSEAARMQDVYLALYEAAQAEGSIRQMDARPYVTLQARIYRWVPKWLDTLSHLDRQIISREVTELIALGLGRK